LTATSRPAPQRHILLRIIQRILIVVAGVYALGLGAFLASRELLAGEWWFALLINFTPLYFLPLLVLIPLTLYWRARVVNVLLVALLVYAVILFGRYYLPKQVAPSAESTLVTLTTFNMSDRNEEPGVVPNWLREQDADIVLLQEAPPEWVNRGIDDLRDLYPYQAGYILANDTNGAVILSKYPLRALHESESYFRAAVVIGAQPIALYNVSLTTPVQGKPREPIYLRNRWITAIWDMAWGYDDSARNRELDVLLRDVENEPLPVIIAGDFNMSDFTPNYDLWLSRLRDSFREAGHGFGGTWPLFKQVPTPGFVRLDYVWHNSALPATQAELGPYLGSDHLPLSVTLQVEQGGEADK
jgi:endonuclease/exonuclease/phosphatase (EEP) superfamily protein YafD